MKNPWGRRRVTSSVDDGAQQLRKEVSANPIRDDIMAKVDVTEDNSTSPEWDCEETDPWKLSRTPSALSCYNISQNMALLPNKVDTAGKAQKIQTVEKELVPCHQDTISEHSLQQENVLPSPSDTGKKWWGKKERKLHDPDSSKDKENCKTKDGKTKLMSKHDTKLSITNTKEKKARSLPTSFPSLWGTRNKHRGNKRSEALPTKLCTMQTTLAQHVGGDNPVNAFARAEYSTDIRGLRMRSVKRQNPMYDK